MKSEQIIRFFKSHGLDAEDDNASITSTQYNQMLDDALTLGGVKLKNLCVDVIDATDGEFYVSYTTWEEILEVYNQTA